MSSIIKPSYWLGQSLKNMEPVNPRTLRLVSLQYELALLIGQHLRLIPMLQCFFPPALKALQFRAAHVWLRNEDSGTLELSYSYPASDAKVWRNVSQYADLEENLRVIPEAPRKLCTDEKTQLLQMPLGDIGHCVMVGGSNSIDPLLGAVLKPIFARLATACQASMDHERVEHLKAVADRGEQRLSSVLETVGEVIFQADTDGNMTFLNAHWTSLTGKGADTCLGCPLSEFICVDDRYRFLDALKASLQDDETHLLEARLLCVNQVIKWVAIRLRRGTADTGNPSITGTILDITTQKNAQRMKQEFTATVSHELRTPLTAIAGSINLLSAGAAGPLPETAQRMIDIAGRSVKRLRVLVDDLLDMEKLLAGKMTFNLEYFSVRRLLQHAQTELQPYANSRDIHLTLALYDNQAMLHADPDRFQQVMNNLVSNAVKFSPEGSEVTVTAELVNEAVRVTVRDNGPGISYEFQSQIFGKFAQADSSDRRQRGGTGLGLAITKELVEGMHGRIGFESVPGDGAAFWFELPRKQAQEVESLPPG